MFNWLKKAKETYFNRVANLFERGSVGEDAWEELEELLIAADVGVETTTKLLDRVKQRVNRGSATLQGRAEPLQVKSALKEEMISLLNIPNSLCHSEGAKRPENLSPDKLCEESPYIILVVGVNGSGKTTSIAKLAYIFSSQGKKVILAAADTFRAAAIDQLKYWGKEVNAEVIAHKPGGDPGAVAFDAIEAAYSRHAQVAIIDTAGRLHTKFNLMEELKKIKRVIAKRDASAPHQTLLVMDATTGQNGLAQAKYFTQAIGITGIFLTKLDGTAKGGIVLAICDELNIPIAYIGTGEKLQDIAPFNAETFVNAIL